MKVYILDEHFTGNGWMVIGVFSSEEKAREYGLKHAKGTIGVTDYEIDDLIGEEEENA